MHNSDGQGRMSDSDSETDKFDFSEKRRFVSLAPEPSQTHYVKPDFDECIREYHNISSKDQGSFKPGSIFYHQTSPGTDSVTDILSLEPMRHRELPGPIEIGPRASPSKPSRNDIFNTPQAVNKPAEQMTEEELLQLREGQNIFKNVSPYQDTSTALIPQLHALGLTLGSPDVQLSDDNRLQGRDSAHSDRRVWVDLDDGGNPVHLTPAIIEPVYTPLSMQMPSASDDTSQIPIDILAKIQAKLAPEISLEDINEINSLADPSTWEHINVTYIPTKASFLGEGQYAQVFRGHYSVADSIVPMSAHSNSLTPVDMKFNEQGQMLKECAVKRMNWTPEAQLVAYSELFVLKRLRHPNIVRLIGAKYESLNRKSPDDPKSRMLIILSFERHGNMWKWIQKHRRRLTKNVWLTWARQLTSAVAYMHSLGLVHHDIKPHNILLSDFGNACFVPECSPTMQDFESFNKQISPESQADESLSQSGFPSPASGTSMSIDGSPGNYSDFPSMTPVSSVESGSPGKSSRMLQDGLGRGTLAYTAPEIFLGQYSLPIDIYALGVTLYTMTTGVEPFSGIRNSVHMIMAIKRGFFESGSQADPRPEGPIYGVSKFLSGELIPEKIIDLLRSMVHIDPSQRPSAHEVCRILEADDL